LSHIFQIIHANRLKVSLIQSSAVTISVCVDNSRFVAQAIEQLQEAYRVTWNENLSLLTVRGTTPTILKHEQEGRDILLSQITRRTAKLVIKD
jgi:aspartate kinase